jgi:hypothetical protein
LLEGELVRHRVAGRTDRVGKGRPGHDRLLYAVDAEVRRCNVDGERPGDSRLAGCRQTADHHQDGSHPGIVSNLAV